MSSGIPSARYLHGREAAFLWNRIRLTRSNPPSRARDYVQRRAVYTAALEQFEQLMVAAGTVGAASRPLPLFYAIEQATRAILAAHRYKPARNPHGLHFDADPTDVLSGQVRPDARGGLFQALAEALQSPGIDGPVSLRALWASLPDLSGSPLPGPPSPLALLAGFPAHTRIITWPRVSLVVCLMNQPVTSAADLESLLDHYPHAAGWLLPDGTRHGGLGHTEMQSGVTGVLLDWRIPNREAGNKKVEQIAPSHRYFGERWIRPAVLSSKPPPPTPIVTWWALLYGLSILCRYHPAAWTAALAVDSSEVAVPSEDALEEGLAAVPHLVSEALDRVPLLLRRDLI